MSENFSGRSWKILVGMEFLLFFVVMISGWIYQGSIYTGILIPLSLGVIGMIIAVTCGTYAEKRKESE